MKIIRLLSGLGALCLFNAVEAGKPLWVFTPLTATTLSVPSNATATVQYQITNQSTKIHTLTMQSIQGITQLTTGLGVCGNPFILTGKASCTLSLQVNGSQLTHSISDGPSVCVQGSTLQCYRPALGDILHITQASPITDATISVLDSPLTLTTNGPVGTLTIRNDSLIVAATNITSNFTGTALDGNVTETGSDCSYVEPQHNCTLTYTPGNTVVPQTNFIIQGSNTNAFTAAIQIDSGVTLTGISPSSGPASGGTGVTLTGTGFTDATSLTFGGTAATSLNVVSSTNATAVTPAQATGAVDVVITTPSGSATKTNGFTYATTAVGQSAYGGTIACLNSGNNLIAATADNSTGIQWGGIGTNVPSAESTTDGATNTANIVNCLTTGGGGCAGGTDITTYAAGICSTYEVDSQGHTPCESGNTCYSDWFLPAGNNTDPSTGQLNCLYTNQATIGGFASAVYWSSTEGNNAVFAWIQYFSGGVQFSDVKDGDRRVRCVRGFNP